MEHGDDTTLSGFFDEHTSFLFYPRFFHDYRHWGGLGTEEEWCNFAVCQKLTGLAVVENVEDYPIRKSKSPPIIVTGSQNQTRFQDSAHEWFQRLGNIYCSSEGTTGSPVWSLCIGTTVASDVFHPFEDHRLNECCGLFLTFSTSANISLYAAELIPHLRVRLTQWLGHKFYRDSHRHTADLRKQAEALDLLQKPLRAISSALSTMQSESQELRAILYEPEEALFASHAAISPFFKDGAPLPLGSPWAKTIQIRHTPNQYKLEDATLVLSCLVCAIFGEIETIRLLPHRDLLTDGVAEIIGKKRVSQATSNLSKVLAWLLTGDENAHLEEFIKRADKDKVVNAILNIKHSLFAPYKAFSNKWHPIAFRLLARSEILMSWGCKCGGELNKDEEVQLPDSPISYSTALAFVRDIALALRAPNAEGMATRTLSEISVRYADNKVVLELTFSREIENSREGLDVSFVRETLDMMAQRAPREWRILDDNFGDSTRPFVFLVNKVLGLEEKGRKLGWAINRMADERVLFACKKNDEIAKVNYTLGVSNCNTKIYMTWEAL